MRVLPLTPKSFSLALSVLKGGGVIIHPTETCYGLACDLTNPAAVARLFTRKKRPLNQPVSALFSSIEQVKQYVLWNAQAETLAKKSLPGPLTLILPLRIIAPHILYPTPPRTSDKGHRTKDEVRTIGIRISSYPIAQELVERFGKPLSTTSANIHGHPPTYCPEEILAQFSDDLPDTLLLDSGTLPARPPSTIIDLTESPPREVRKGN